MTIDVLLSTLVLGLTLIVLTFNKVLMVKYLLSHVHFDMFIHLLSFEWLYKVKLYHIPVNDGSYHYLYFSRTNKGSKVDDTLEEDYFDSELQGDFVLDHEHGSWNKNFRYKFIYNGTDYRLTRKQMDSLCMLSGASWDYRSKSGKNKMDEAKNDEILQGLESNSKGLPVLHKVGEVFGCDIYHPIPLEAAVANILSGRYLNRRSSAHGSNNLVVRCFYYRDRFINLFLSVATSIATYFTASSAFYLSLLNLAIVIFHYNMGVMYLKSSHFIHWMPKIYLSKYKFGFKVLDFLENFDKNWGYCDKVKKKVYNGSNRFVFDLTGSRKNYKEVFRSDDADKMRLHFPELFKTTVIEKAPAKIPRYSENKRKGVREIELTGDALLILLNKAISNDGDDEHKIYRSTASRPGVVHIEDYSGVRVLTHRMIYVLSDSCYVEGTTFQENLEVFGVKQISTCFSKASGAMLLKHYSNFTKDLSVEKSFLENFTRFYRTGSVIKEKGTPNTAWKRLTSDCAKILEHNGDSMLVKYDKRGDFVVTEELKKAAVDYESAIFTKREKLTKAKLTNKIEHLKNKVIRKDDSLMKEKSGASIPQVKKAVEVFNMQSSVITQSKSIESYKDVVCKLGVTVVNTSDCDNYLAVAKELLEGEKLKEEKAGNTPKIKLAEEALVVVASVQELWKPAARKTYTNSGLKKLVKSVVKVPLDYKKVSVGLAVNKYDKNQDELLLRNYYECLDETSENIDEVVVMGSLVMKTSKDSKSKVLNQRNLKAAKNSRVSTMVNKVLRKSAKDNMINIVLRKKGKGKVEAEQGNTMTLYEEMESTSRSKWDRRCYYSIVNSMATGRCIELYKAGFEYLKIPFIDKEKHLKRLEEYKALLMSRLGSRIDVGNDLINEN